MRFVEYAETVMFGLVMVFMIHVITLKKDFTKNAKVVENTIPCRGTQAYVGIVMNTDMILVGIYLNNFFLF